ncbi:MAG: hypothetical protein MJZ21_05570 [archaeon]|nr:hypothetical protein [archaeon]
MLQRKKLEYYAKQNGIEDLASIKLTDDDCRRICDTVGVRFYPAADIGCNICKLIESIMDDKDFIESHRKPDTPTEIFLIRCGDYAAMEVFKAYVNQ